MATETAATLPAKQSDTPPTKAPLEGGGKLGAIVPQNAEQAFRMAQLILKSGIAPRDMRSPEAITTAIFHGLELGMKPMQAVQSIAVINGRPTVWGDAAIGLVQASGLMEKFEEIIEGEGDNMDAICRTQRVGNPCPIERHFDVADAKRAGLWGKKGPWSQYPKRMLQMRARSWALRDGFSDVLKGMSVTEEVRDYHIGGGAIVSETASITAADITAQATGKPAPPANVEPDTSPDAAPDDTALQKEARDIATMGHTRMTEYWGGLDNEKKKALLTIKDELASIADQSDREAAETVDENAQIDDGDNVLDDNLPPQNGGDTQSSDDLGFN